MIDQEVAALLSDHILSSAHRMKAEWAMSTGFFNHDELVWYMPLYFIKALQKHYYREVGMVTNPKKPQLMGIEIREGYEPCLVLTMKDMMAFTRPEYTIKGENLVKKPSIED